MAFFLSLSLSGCAEWPYYWQAVEGQLDLMARRRPVEAVLQDAATPHPLRQRLANASRMRQFAVTELGLPVGDSFADYADLQRPYATWVVFATPEFSLEPKRWCFPFTGCLAYRGYFSKEEAVAFADGLRREGWDVHDGGSPAYSTLGWFADPLLNTCIEWPDFQLAGLMFHELAHARVYVKNDTAFNESFADAVSRVGVERWLRHQGVPGDDWRSDLRAKHRLLRLVKKTRERLETLYAQPLTDQEKREQKKAILQEAAREEEVAAKEQGGPSHVGWWRKGVNNAKLLAVNLYAQWVPAFLTLLDEQGGEMEWFYQEVVALAQLPHAERKARLEELARCGGRSGAR